MFSHKYHKVIRTQDPETQFVLGMGEFSALAEGCRLGLLLLTE